MKTAENYRIRREAMDAAVFTIGPHARHGFEYTTVKCDGRWLWKPTDEVPPLTAAQIKAEGGKRCLINPTTGGTAMAQPDTITPACNGLDVAPVPLSPAAEQLGRMGFTDVAQNPSDGLTIPAFLKREASPEEMDKVRKKLAKAVGPDRIIKNPPDAKAAAKPSPTSVVPGTDTSKWGKDRAARHAHRKAGEETSPVPVSDSPKRAKRAGKAPTKRAGYSKGQTKTALVGELLTRKEGCTTADVLALTGWPSVSMPAAAKACGLVLRKEKVPSEPTRYFGSKG
jgi:hypothetical protein